jgi:hypothetical protein
VYKKAEQVSRTSRVPHRGGPRQKKETKKPKNRNATRAATNTNVLDLGGLLTSLKKSGSSKGRRLEMCSSVEQYDFD